MKTLATIFSRLVAGAAALLVIPIAYAVDEPLRPPAVPLVTSDPYLSIWSPADHLSDADTMHWTRHPQRLTGLVRIDGKPYRVLGAEPDSVRALPQRNLEILPTRTIYTFDGAGVELVLTFMTAALPEDLMIYSRPVTYVTWKVRATDGGKHQVSVYFDASGEIAVNEPRQQVSKANVPIDGLNVLKIGSVEQPTLTKKGDDLRIDWGYLYAAMPVSARAVNMVSSRAALRDAFVQNGTSGTMNIQTPAAAEAGTVVAAFAFDLGKVGPESVSRWLMVAYDEEYAIQYFHQNLRPYWRRNGDDAVALLKKSADDYALLVERCAKFDEQFLADLRRVGGEKYARLGALLFRQTIAGTKLVADANGQPLLFPKENTSNGCIGTVDVIYPMSPFFLLFGPSLSKAMLVPPMDYASSPRWRFPFAPHDLGTYPLANGQVYGGGERTEDDQMPVEETANLIILTTALAEMEGNAEFAGKYWPLLAKWADYLKARGFDPERQLCTDDFAGHLAHNVNLSAKAIVALGAYGHLCALRGEKDAANAYSELAHEYAARWEKAADDGDHFRLAFDQPGSWSQKYNLIWDRVLGLKLFPETALRKEMDYYLGTMDQFGLALDNRKPYAELPWTFWTASLTGDREDFETILDPIYDYADQTPSRVPFPDFYWTRDSKEAGMHARPVVGGIYIPALLDHAIWEKWAGQDLTKAANWAPFPPQPKITVVVPAADTAPATWRYTTTRPSSGWQSPDYSASSWSEGRSGFGTDGTPGGVIGTVWNSGDIWMRREVNLPGNQLKNLQAWIHHDEDAEVYLNGVLALKTPAFITSYECQPLTAAGQAALKPGKNLIAVHCHQTTGGQYIDFGLVEVELPRGHTLSAN